MYTHLRPHAVDMRPLHGNSDLLDRGRRWAVIALVAATGLLSGCSTPIEADQVSGTYRSAETGGELRLEPDGTFLATGISGDEAVGSGGTDTADFSGEWEVVDFGSDDVVYLSIDEGLGGVHGFPLNLHGQDAFELRPDPDGPVSLVLEREA
ncbi:hypothetical protein [Promicromonospora aerolata]|uniref:Secreted protein n=1 Tax=Promicromonospora aerolata TaxID=195749 RepID=A0ABW4VCV0_9MICO